MTSITYSSDDDAGGCQGLRLNYWPSTCEFESLEHRPASPSHEHLHSGQSVAMQYKDVSWNIDSKAVYLQIMAAAGGLMGIRPPQTWQPGKGASTLGKRS